MRIYHFTNYYLSGIQHGIQSEHSAVELFVKYQGSEPQKEMLFDWATNHKTAICLNGGNLASMTRTWEKLDTLENTYPYSKFHEDEASLGGIMTNISIIIPEHVYNAAALKRNGRNGTTTGFSDFDKDLVDILCSHSLA